MPPQFNSYFLFTVVAVIMGGILLANVFCVVPHSIPGWLALLVVGIPAWLFLEWLGCPHPEHLSFNAYPARRAFSLAFLPCLP